MGEDKITAPLVLSYSKELNDEIFYAVAGKILHDSITCIMWWMYVCLGLAVGWWLVISLSIPADLISVKYSVLGMCGKASLNINTESVLTFLKIINFSWPDHRLKLTWDKCHWKAFVHQNYFKFLSATHTTNIYAATRY